jgi:uncharacterized protein (DUF58 family)
MAGVKGSRTTLTTRGRCLLAGGIATAACAVALDERDLLRVGAFVALLPLLALVLAALGRRTVRVRRTPDAARVPVGTATEVELAVHGRAAVGPLDLLDTVPDAAGAPRPPRFTVTPRSSGVRVRYPLRPVLRGAHRLGPAVVHGVDPLGLAEFARTVPGTDRLLVLPRTTVLRGLPPALGSADGAHGAGAARAGQGRSDVLVRPYRSGDELRRVHWRSTARHGELMVRLEEQPWRGGVTVLLDRRAGAHRGHGPSGSLEWAVAFVASVGVHLLERGEPVEVVTDDGGPLPATDTPGVDPLLEALATVRASARAGLDGPPLPTSADVLAVLGATTPDDVAALLARCRGRGHAVLLDVAAWARDSTEGSADAAAALRAAGWAVTVVGRGTSVSRAWDALVATPVPQGVST